MNQEQYQKLKHHLSTKCVGKRNAQTADLISEKLGFDVARHLRSKKPKANEPDPVPLRLLEDGIILCADCSTKTGYYIPTNFQEYEEYTGQLRSRAHSMFIRIKKADQLAIQLFGGQQSLAI